MNFQITNFAEPSRVKMIWQSSSPEVRTHFHVANLVRAGTSVSLFYEWYESDFLSAMQAGFTGHPAFSPHLAVHHTNVLEVMSKRLPPRNRSDFTQFLWKHGLANNPGISDLALIGYTGARLPGDGFSFEVDWSLETPAFQFFFDVAGFRYYAGMHLPMDSLIGQPVSFVAEPENPHDSNAIAVFVGSTMIGHVPRTLASTIRNWFYLNQVSGFVARVEGPAIRPMVYIYLAVTRPMAQMAVNSRASF